MKVKVKRPFLFKVTTVSEGDEIIVTDQHAKDLLKNGLIEQPKDEQPKTNTGKHKE